MVDTNFFETLEAIISEYLPIDKIELIRRAYVVANEAHRGQFRSSGEPYIIHPVAVAEMIAGMKLDHEAVMAALLHDVIEDTPYTEEELAKEFGKNVAQIVDGVSKLDKLKFRTRKEAIAENFKKMILAMTKDIRVILIKLADRTHNMRTLGPLRPDKQRRIAKETLEIYVPLAHRIGIASIKHELERLSFRALHPHRYKTLQKAISYARSTHKGIVNVIISDIKQNLNKMGISARVFANEKSVYSIYQQLKLKKQNFQSITDICYFNIITDFNDTCYRILGILHSMYKPKPGSIKDYIAVPKANGYQSLQTYLMGTQGLPIEAHIYTEKMFEVAEQGIVSYWAYDQEQERNLNYNIYDNTQRWLQSLIELQQNTGNTIEFVDNVKSDLFPNEIYVFTPKGKIIALPVGATAIDFAYAVHTDIGFHCIGVNIDHDASPLSQPLVSGQTVDIITSEFSSPSAIWLDFVVTAKARSEIRKALKDLQYDEAVNFGRKLLITALEDYHTNLADISQEQIEKVLQLLDIKSFDELLADIGLGNRTNYIVAKQLLSINDNLIQIDAKHKLTIAGTEGLLVKLASCCRPIPYDPIVANVMIGEGLYTHHLKCNQVKKERKHSNFIPVSWKDVKASDQYETNIVIMVREEHGILAKLIPVITEMNSNINAINTDKIDNDIYKVSVSITTNNSDKLIKIMRKLKKINNVLDVTRNINSA